MSDSLRPHELHPARLLCPWNSPGKNTGVGCCSLLQRIFSTQELNLGLEHCRGIFIVGATREAVTADVVDAKLTTVKTTDNISHLVELKVLSLSRQS